MGPISIQHKCPVRERRRENIDTEEKATCKQRQELECCSHKPRDARSHGKPNKSKEGVSPRAPGGSMTLLRPRFCTSGFQSWETINACGLSHQVWGNLLQLSQEINLRGESRAGHLEEGYCRNPGETRCCLGLWWEQQRAGGCPIVKVGWLWFKKL